MRDPDGGVRGIDVLAAFTRGTIRIDPKILFLDDDLNRVVDSGINGDRRERSVAAFIGIERRNSYEPMHTRLGREIAEGVVTHDLKRGGLDSRFFTVL